MYSWQPADSSSTVAPLATNLSTSVISIGELYERHITAAHHKLLVSRNSVVMMIANNNHDVVRRNLYYTHLKCGKENYSMPTKLHCYYSNNSIVAHIGQLIRQYAQSPIGDNVACFRYKFEINSDDKVLKNLSSITRYSELSAERNITASIAIDLQCMMEDNHVRFTRDELNYMLNNVCTTWQLTCN